MSRGPGTGIAIALLSITAAVGCTEISGNHPDVASARLLAEDGTELTPLVRVPDGEWLVVEARFLDASGEEIPLRNPEHATDLRWSPGELLKMRDVPGQPFRRAIAIRTPCTEGPHSVWIGYGHWGRASEREFGPFEVEPVSEVGSVRMFGPDSVELTPELRLPHDQPLRIDVRLYGCDGEELDDLPGAYGVTLSWSEPGMVQVAPVEGDRFSRDVTAVAPVGTTGQVTIEYGTDAEPQVRELGVWPVEVVEPQEPPTDSVG